MFFTPQILGSRGQTFSAIGRVGIAIAVIAVLVLSGCGQKGPLYMPVLPQKVPLQQVPSAGAVAPAATSPALAAPAAAAPASAAR
jgi:predicted small lipoprotein YifL